MANNGVYYSSGNSLNFTTNNTTWATLTSGGTFEISTVSATTYLNLASGNFTGGTVAGATNFTGGLSANTFSASTYENLPITGVTSGTGISVTSTGGGGYQITNTNPDQTVVITGGTNIQIVSAYPNFGVNFTGTTSASGDYLPLSGGTVTGGTVFQSGLTANTFYTNYIDFNTSSTPVNNEGRLIWNNADEIGGLEVTMMSGNTVLQIGEENLARVYNADTVTLTAGTVVYVFGSQGNTISVKRASNSGETTSSRALGVVSESIAVGARGFVNTFGLVKNLNTSAYSGGTPIWLGTTPGSWTSTEPDAPNHTVLIGFISRSATSPNGSLFVHINNGWELNELHNVYAPNPTNGNILKYSAATSVWVNSDTINLNGVTATTISATTYQNLPTDIRTTGATYSNNTFTYTNNTGGTYSVLFNTVTGLTVNGSLNVTGTTTFTSQFNANSGVRFSGLSSVAATRVIVSDNTGNIAYREDIVKGSGTTNSVTKWTNVEQIVDSQIVDDGNQVYIGGGLTHATSKFGVVAPIEFQGIQMTQINSSIAITDSDLGGWLTGGQEIAIGIGNPLAGSTGTGNIAIGYQSMNANSTGINNVAIGFRSLLSNQAGQGNIALGYRAGINVDSGSYNVLIGYEAGSDLTTEDNRLYIANNTYGTLIYGEFDNGIVNIDGTLSATTYQNLPVSAVTNGSGISTSTSNGVVTVTNSQVQGITGKTDGTGISSSISNNVLTITNTDLGSSQNIFKNIQINGVTQFAANSNTSNLNFSGINVTITSAATNTLVFSAGTGGGGGGSGTVTSVTLAAGTTGSDVNISNPTITTSGTITLNIPDASATARGLVTTGTQTFAGTKTFSTVYSNTVSATTYQNLPVSAVTNGSGISSSTSNGVVTISNTQVQGITGITAGSGISASTTNNVTTITQRFDYGKSYTTGNNLNFI